MASEYFPNDIMQNVGSKNLDKVSIGSFTEYMIGWTDQLEAKYEPLLSDRIF
jgi:hypothetical protein